VERTAVFQAHVDSETGAAAALSQHSKLEQGCCFAIVEQQAECDREAMLAPTCRAAGTGSGTSLVELTMAQSTRTFRIFVSSTFSDLTDERNALQKYVFPRLRDLCIQHGCRFQAIDLRWGVRDEAGLDQQTMKICLDEVYRSQRASPRPNFIVLLGDRYGWRPLPAEIPAQEFEEIERHVADGTDKELLRHWYRRDNNVQLKRGPGNTPEPVYRLEPRRPEGRFADFGVWEVEVERPLRQSLLKAIAGMTLNHDERLKYEASATEQEIAAGALKVADANEHVFCFFRSLTNLPDDRSAGDFVDLDQKGALDSDARARLAQLKNRLETHMPGNIHHYDASWAGDGTTTDHIGQLPASLEDCLRFLDGETPHQTLCVDVWKRLARTILEEIKRLEHIEPLEKEITDHEAFGENRARLFVGRASILQIIGNYVRSADRHPLAVVGESGSGKSALMARAIAESTSQMPGCVIVSRFIGATPASSDVRALLEGLCRQISRRYGADETLVPTAYEELVKDLPQRLALASEERHLVLFLDALDQLSDANHARNLTWLPTELPENVRVIVSTLPVQCHSALERKLPAASFARLEPMPNAEGRELLQRWLDDAGRTLQPIQTEEVFRKFAACGLPLYLKLAFEEARRWKSHDEDISLAADIPGLVRQLLDRLSSDANHGAILVSRSLGYLAAARNGLSEDELLDVLSGNREVRADFRSRARHTPPEEHLPVVVWSRLYFDLEPYLTERSADGASLLGFYHRQVHQVVEEEYLARENKAARHAELAEYFAGQGLVEKEKKIPNLRKLSELPYQQTHGERWDDLYTTLTDFDFLEAKCTHVAVVTSGQGKTARTIYGGVYELQEDYRRALEALPGGGGPRRGTPRGRPIIVTATDLGRGIMVHCPFCNQEHPFREEWLGKEIECPTESCRGPLRVNSFVVHAPR
jgi:NACHT domain- and WD repeat-containing protein